MTMEKEKEEEAAEGISFSIPIPEGVNVSVNVRTVKVEGPKGAIERELWHPGIQIEQKDDGNELIVKSDTGDGGTIHWSDREYVGECSKCHGPYDLTAGGFGLTPRAYDDGTKAAHKTFVLDAINNTHMEGANEACIGCHTHVPVKINWTHAYSLEFDATYTPGGGYFVTNRTHFNVSGWAVNGTVNITSYGNASGGANTSYFPPPVTVWDE
ncbi:MAG: 50S ribosomal protein L6 [Methanosarcinales archaeon]|nr:50S ribosomal protein L6 [Methanosarcinales archaeon]